MLAVFADASSSFDINIQVLCFKCFILSKIVVRSKKSSLAYKEISYEGIDVVEHEVVEPNSPINYFTKMQTSKLQEYLEANPDLSEYSFGVYYAMRYWHPYVNEVRRINSLIVCFIVET